MVEVGAWAQVNIGYPPPREYEATHYSEQVLVEAGTQ